MLTPEVVEVLQSQINKEYQSAYLYMAMSQRCKKLGFDGAAHWLRFQSIEELMHGEKMTEYLNMCDVEVEFEDCPKPEVPGQSLVEIYKHTLSHEQMVTKSIYNIVAVCRQQVDFATEHFMQWFVGEQVEEEANVKDIIAKLELIGDDGSNLYLIDKELGTRPMPTAPPQ